MRAFDVVEAAEAAKTARGDAQGAAGVFAGGVEAGDAFNASTRSMRSRAIFGIGFFLFDRC